MLYYYTHSMCNYVCIFYSTLSTDCGLSNLIRTARPVCLLEIYSCYLYAFRFVIHTCPVSCVNIFLTILKLLTKKTHLIYYFNYNIITCLIALCFFHIFYNVLNIRRKLARSNTFTLSEINVFLLKVKINGQKKNAVLLIVFKL